MDTKDKLPESRFIHEGVRENPYPFWFWLFLLVILISLVIGLQSWSHTYFEKIAKCCPFDQVKEREFSLFLWQHPEIVVEKGYADKYVAVPSDVLFRYHAWKRQVKSEYPKRRIDIVEFLEFLGQVPGWAPENWNEAPEAYTSMVETLPYSGIGNLQELLEESFPNDVRFAFLGWKNSTKEKEEIAEFAPTYAQMQTFLAKYPHYARNYWKNSISDRYLRTFSFGSFSPDHTIPEEELAPFLKIALYNEMHISD